MADQSKVLARQPLTEDQHARARGPHAQDPDSLDGEGPDVLTGRGKRTLTIRNFPDKLDLELDLTTTQMEGTDGKKFPALDSPDLQRAKERDGRML